LHNSKSLKISNLYKNFQTPSQTVEVLRGISFQMNEGEAIAITGPSGAGKSTLLHILGTLDEPTSGNVEINGKNPFSLPEAELAHFRNRVIGFIFQDHHLLPQYTVLENVLIPTFAFKNNGEDKKARAVELIDKVGLSGRIDHRPAELSGGERQRVAIARALINRPSLLLCDEPTGNLDFANAESVTSLLFELHREEKNILIVVTHSLEVAARFPARFEFKNGICVTT
jgi:lipoprotein-releasing system ATP-binding protein